VHKNIKELTGKTFNYLTVLKLAQTKPVLWLCRCECGVEKFIDTSNLVLGRTKSCGCKKAEMVGNATRSHGKTGTAEYKTWIGIKGRCKYPYVNGYKNYGGRGISVCTEWDVSFLQFLEDMGKKPDSSYTIERKDTDGNYERGNCYWATPEEQARNKRTNRVIEFNGESMIMTDWAKRIGISVQALNQRIRRGESLDRALTAKRDENPVRQVVIEGKSQTIKEWCEELKISRKTLYKRYDFERRTYK